MRRLAFGVSRRALSSRCVPKPLSPLVQQVADLCKIGKWQAAQQVIEGDNSQSSQDESRGNNSQSSQDVTHSQSSEDVTRSYNALMNGMAKQNISHKVQKLFDQMIDQRTADVATFAIHMKLLIKKKKETQAIQLLEVMDKI